MNTDIRKIALLWTVPVLLLITLAMSLALARATDSSPSTERPAIAARPTWTKVSVELPLSEDSFPPGDGAEITPQCLICHSAGMVLRQPPLTQEEWVGEINKMRSAFGAPLPADQVETLAKYLTRINGRQSRSVPAVDGESG
jgi:hypothetical protein